MGPSAPVERFMALAERGLALFAAVGALEAAPILEEAYDLFTPSSAEGIPQAAALYADVGRALARSENDRGDHEAAILYLLRVVAADPFDAHAHLALIKSASDARRHGEARRYYAIYAARMEGRDAPLEGFPGRGRDLRDRSFTGLSTDDFRPGWSVVTRNLAKGAPRERRS